MEISIVITNYNGINLLKETLPTVIDAAIKDPDNYYEILLIDDSSKDESVQFVKNTYFDIKIFVTPKNMGYMNANNFGVSKAKFPYVFCMNNDMKLTDKTISHLAVHFKDQNVFAASGKIFDWENKFLYGNRGGYFEKGHFSYFEKDENETHTQTLFACGGAFLCKKKIYEDLGGYDAELYHPYYYDETDLCFRALKMGFKIIYEPLSIAYHKVSQTAKKQYDTSQIKIISARNNYFFSIKNIHDKDLTKEMIKYIPLFLLRDFFKWKFRFIKAFFEVLKKWNLLMRKRKEEKIKGGKTSKEIFKAVTGK